MSLFFFRKCRSLVLGSAEGEAVGEGECRIHLKLSPMPPPLGRNVSSLDMGTNPRALNSSVN